MEIGSQNPLPFVVECKEPRREPLASFFEPIAAFNVEQAALAYARECADINGARGYEYRVVRSFFSHPNMSAKECSIVSKLLDDVLTAGYAISVYDGEEWCLDRSIAKASVWDALASTDSDEIVLTEIKDGKVARAGWLRLVWGNDADVISDYSFKLETLLSGANALAEELANG